MPGSYFLSEADVMALREVIAEHKARLQQVNTQNRAGDMGIDHQEFFAPEVYVALIPSGGIGGAAGTSGVLDSVSCPIYRVIDDTLVAIGQGDKIVYNLGSEVAGDQYALVARDKFGTWFITSSVGVGAGPTVRLVTNVCEATGTSVGEIKVQYQEVTLPAGSTVGSPFCITDPTDCCLTCSCGATVFLVTGSDFTGAFTGFACNQSNSCCEDGFPNVITASMSSPGGPLDGVTFPIYYNPGGGPPLWSVGPFPGVLASAPCGTRWFTAALACLSNGDVEVTWGETLNPNDIGPFGGVQALTEEGIGSLTCSPFSVSFTGQFFPQLAYGTDPSCGCAGTTGTVTFTGTIGDGFNDTFALLPTANAVCNWKFNCPGTTEGGGTVTAGLDANNIATITYIAPSGDTAVYKVDMTPGCCGTYTAELYSTTASGSVPETIMIQGIGCPEGGGGTGTGGGSSGGGISVAQLGSANTSTPISVIVQAGALLVVVIGYDIATAPTAMTFAGLPMTKVRDSATAPGSSEWILAVGITTNGTITPTTTAGGYGYVAFEVIGLALNTSDVGSSGSGSASSPDTGTTGTTATANEVAVFGACEQGTFPIGGFWSTTPTLTVLYPFAAASFTSGGNDYEIHASCAIMSVTGTIDAVLSSLPVTWSAVVETYR